jgi:hypothetical protein
MGKGMIQTKYKIARIIERVQGHEWGAEGLVQTFILQPCCIFLPEVFENVGEACEFRDLKDYPEDYVIMTIW